MLLSFPMKNDGEIVFITFMVSVGYFGDQRKIVMITCDLSIGSIVFESENLKTFNYVG